MNTHRIFITRAIPDAGVQLLRERGHEVDVSTSDGVLSVAALREALSSKPYDGLISLLTDRIDAGVFEAAPSLRIVADYAVGYDNIDLREATARGVVVTNTPGVLTNAVAEHTIALMLAAARRIVESDQLVRAGRFTGWSPQLLLGSELAGKTLGVVGLGRIGSRVAHVAMRGFGMKIVYCDAVRNEAFERDYDASFTASVDELLPQADIVTLHLPLSPETHHLFTAKRLGLMKRSAILVNSSRGPIIDEQALVDALRSRTIAAAALDVFEHEPELAAGLSDLPNVILTPHTASATIEARSAMSVLAARNVIEVLEGRPAISAVS